MHGRRLTRRCSEPRPGPMRSFGVANSSNSERRVVSDAVADLVSR